MRQLSAEAALQRREELAKRNFYDELIAIRDRQRQDLVGAYPVVGESSIPWEVNRQGVMRWYVAPTMTDVAVRTVKMYVQRIPVGSRSGKQLTPGGDLAFVWKGASGYSIIDDERHEWATYDLIQIPRRTKGSVVQHFNAGDDEIFLIFCAPNTTQSAFVDRGSGFEQIESCPEFGQDAAQWNAPE